MRRAAGAGRVRAGVDRDDDGVRGVGRRGAGARVQRRGGGGGGRARAVRRGVAAGGAAAGDVVRGDGEGGVRCGFPGRARSC